MNRTKAQKQEMVTTLAGQVAKSQTIYVTDFTGLNVAHITDLRRRLRAIGVEYVVVKNTLAQRALAANKISAFDPHLTGPVGLVLAGADPLPSAKVVGDFAKEFQKPTVKIGLIEGKPVEPSYVKRLGELPPRDVLLAQFAGCLNGVLYQVVATLEAFRDQRQASNSTEN